MVTEQWLADMEHITNMELANPGSHPKIEKALSKAYEKMKSARGLRRFTGELESCFDVTYDSGREARRHIYC